MAPPRGTGAKPVDFEPVSFQLTGGVDTKWNGLVLPQPKLQVCENAFVDETGSIQRRPGRTAVTLLDSAGNTVADWVASAVYQGRLIGFTNSKLYDYSEATSRWQDTGRATSWRARTKPVDAGDITTVVGGAQDMAVTVIGAGYTCYAYEYYESTGANTITRVAITLVDGTGVRYVTNKVLAQATAAGARASSVRVVAHGALFYVVYWDVNTAGNLKCFIVDTTSASTLATSLAASATTLAANLGIVAATYAPLDLCDTVWHGPFVCYRSTTANTIAYGHITTAGALTHASTASSGAADCVTIACDATSLGLNNVLHGIVFTLGTAPSDVYALLRSHNGSAWTTVASSGAMDTALTAALTRAVACKFDSVTVLRVFYDNDTNVTYPCLRQGTYSTAGVIAPQVERLNRSYMASKPFTGTDGSTYIWVINEETTRVQPTLFLMKSDGTLAGVANQGIAILPTMQPYGLGHVVADASGKSFSMMCLYLTHIGTDGIGTTGAFREVIVDMQHGDSHVVVEDGSCLYIPSAIMQQYDGVSCTEVGFLQYVDVQNRISLGAAASSNTVAGALTSAAGTIYAYRVIPEWTNAQGQREQGTDNGPKATAAFAAGDDTVTFTIDCIPWTLKQNAKTNVRRQNLVWAVYRTLANPTADSPHYRVGTAQNDPTLDTVTFVDTMADATAALQEQLGADAELDGTAPAPGYIVAAGNGRVVVAGLPDDPYGAQYSKTRTHGQPLTFNDALLIAVPPATGAITSVVVQNDSVLFFCERAIYRVNGSGLNNAGTAGGFTEPILVATNDGAVGPRGTVVTPGGVMFQSAARGIALLPLSMAGVAYIGAPLEKLTDPGACRGACAVPALQQVRFSFDSVTYVFDYYHQQWYLFTHGSSGPTCVWNGAHAGVVSGLVYEDTTVWSDAGTAYTMELVLGWMGARNSRFADLRIRSVGLVGESLAAHYLAVYVGYDESASSDFNDDDVLAAAVIKRSWRTNRQRCSMVQVTIRDAALDVYGADLVKATAGMKLTELVLELGLESPMLGRDV